MRLDRFKNPDFQRGRPLVVELLWLVASAVLVASSVPGSRMRTMILRAFGARIAAGVVIKPRVRIKFPWRLSVGEHAWIGEGVWIDNLAEVTIGDHVCLSQEAYLCTGSHDWAREGFDLITGPITVETQAWVCARAVVGPRVTIGRGAVLGLGAVATGDLAPETIFGAAPPVLRKARPPRQ